jgi:two-component system, NarL family, sensor histidine kinase UhpB
MPLRLRLIGSIGLVLLVTLACGSALLGWHAVNSVKTELRAALGVGERTVRNGLAELPHDRDSDFALRELIATFDGNRHVRAMLVDERDASLATSKRFDSGQTAPDWFLTLIDRGLGEVRVRLGPDGEQSRSIVLRTDPANEIGEVWTESRDSVLVLAGFAALSALVICAVVGRALRPLEALSNAFEQIGDGDFRGGMPENGPPELIRLAAAFNAMTQRLASTAAQNRRLNERLLTLQAEERAELARDLHDEIGPLLFAVNMTAATIERFAECGREREIPTQVRSLRDAVGRMQRHVRSLLGRLRPVWAVGLEAALHQLVSFWQTRRPDIAFEVRVALGRDDLDDGATETIYRVAQEGLSNAVRHARPGRIEVTVVHEGDDGIRVEVVDDGAGMAQRPERNVPQLGLIGMRERVMAMAGSLTMRGGPDGRGLVLSVRLPCTKSLTAEHMTGAE